jgi:hypothetical protein
MTDQNDIPPVEPLPDVPPAPYVPENAPRVDPYAPPAAPVAPPPPPATAPPGYSPYGQVPPGYAPTGYQPGYGQPQYGYPGQYQAPAPTGLSVASLVLGIVGVVGSFFYGFGLFPAIAALITGLIARKRQPQAKGMWLTGIITGSVGIAISVLWIIGIIIFFAFIVSNSATYGDFVDPGFGGSNS